MRKAILKLLILSMILSPALAVAHGGRGPAHRPTPRPAPRPCPPPRHCGGEWVAVGGIAYLTGTVIRAATQAPSTTVVYTQPQTVVVQPSATTVVEQPATTVVVQTPATLSKSQLKADLASNLAGCLQNIPYSVEVGDFYSAGGELGATISVTVSVGGNNYSISSGGNQPNYNALKAYLTNEIVNAVGKLVGEQKKTTVTQIS